MGMRKKHGKETKRERAGSGNPSDWVNLRKWACTCTAHVHEQGERDSGNPSNGADMRQ